MGIFKYTVELSLPKKKLKKESGLVFAEDFEDAVRKMVEYYSDDLYAILYLRIISDEEVIPIPEEITKLTSEIEKCLHL